MGVIAGSSVRYQVCRMFVLLSVFLLSYSALNVLAEEDLPVKNSRLGKMFLVSSSTSITTISTTTYCYATNTVTTACGKRRKRAIHFVEGMEDDDIDSGELAPSKVRDLQSSEVDQDSPRDPRFVMYWMTTTSTSVTTSFTATTTISKLDCTPSGFTMSE